MRKMGFTLIELLVVIAIIAILAAILFPVFTVAKARGQQVKCMSNMRQIGMAIIKYSDDWNGYTPYPHPIGTYEPWWPTSPDKVEQYNWRNRIMPFLKNEAILKCPMKTHAPKLNLMGGKDRGHYGINVYLVLMNRPAGKVGFVQLQSEVSQATKTILVGENWDGDWSAEPFNNSGTGAEGKWWPYHPAESDKDTTKGSVFVFCDGHAKWMSVAQTEENDFWWWRRDK